MVRQEPHPLTLPSWRGLINSARTTVVSAKSADERRFSQNISDRLQSSTRKLGLHRVFFPIAPP